MATQQTTVSAANNPWEPTSNRATSQPVSYTDTAGPRTVTTNTTGTQTSTQNQYTSGSKTTNVQNMSSANLAALDKLIAQLMSGGTPQMRAQLQQIAEETAAVRALRGDYSKSAAFGDAQGAMAQAMRQSLEKMLPSLTRAAEGAGTSANAMRALLLQDAATRSSEAASALGLKAAVDYGNISTNASNILAKLATENDPVTQALLGALNIAKGAVSSSSEQTSGSTQTTGTTDTTQTQTQYTPETSTRREYDDTLPNTTTTSSFSPYSYSTDPGYSQSFQWGPITQAELDALARSSSRTSDWTSYQL